MTFVTENSLENSYLKVDIERNNQYYIDKLLKVKGTP